MPAVRRSLLLKSFWRIHRWIYARSGGQIGSKIMGTQVIRLTTLGRKSGQPRSVLLNGFLVDGEYVVVGSNAGAESHSHWYLNLATNPAVKFEVGGLQIEAVARTTQGDERDRLWSEVTSADPSYAEYPRRTEREIPIVVLERQNEDNQQ